MGEPIASFSYRPRTSNMVLGGLFFGCCAVVLAIRAATNNQGLTIVRGLELPPAMATGFYWLLTAISTGFVALAVFQLVGSRGVRSVLELGPQGLVIPDRWAGSISIRYDEIRSLANRRVARQQFLVIETASRQALIPAGLFRSGAEFDRFHRLLSGLVHLERHGYPLPVGTSATGDDTHRRWIESLEQPDLQ